MGLRGERRKRRASDGSRGHQWPSEALRGHQRPSEAIRGHQWPSVAIRGNQWGDLITIEKHGRVQRAGGVASRLSHILGASVWPAQRWRETSMTVSTRARPTLGWSSEGSRACVDLCRSETRTLVRSHTARLREVKCLIMRLYLLEANWLSGRCTNSELSRHTTTQAVCRERGRHGNRFVPFENPVPEREGHGEKGPPLRWGTFP